MSDVSAVDLQKWTGIVKEELTKNSVIVDEMMEIHDLDDSEDTVIPIVVTGEATEYDKKDSRLPSTDNADIARRLVHNPSMEINDHIWWEDQHKIPYKHIDKKTPLMAKKTALGFARRFAAWVVKSSANFGAAAATDNIISGDFTADNASLNTLIINTLNETRKRCFTDNGNMPDPMECFVGMNSFLFGRLHSIQEIKGREFRFDGMGGVRRFKTFQYGDMTLFELIAGLGENLTTGNNGFTAKTPSKMRADLSGYPACAWWKPGVAAGFVNGGNGNAGFVPNTQIPIRHVNFETNWHWEDRRWVLHTDMIFDLLHIYADATTASECVTNVAWKQSP